MKKDNNLEASTLRKKAEEIKKKKLSKKISQPSEPKKILLAPARL